MKLNIGSIVLAIILILVSQVAFSAGVQEATEVRGIMKLLMNQRQIEGTWEGKQGDYTIGMKLSVGGAYELVVWRGIIPIPHRQSGDWAFVDTETGGILRLDPGVRSDEPTTHEVTFLEDDKICVEVESLVDDCIVLERKGSAP